MGAKDEVFFSRFKLDLLAVPEVLHNREKKTVAAEMLWFDSCGYLQQVSVVSWKFVWESKSTMQAEGGFGSRQFGIGCLDSVIEFGPQSLCRRQNNSACKRILHYLKFLTSETCSQSSSPRKI
jgi:hypothetical protein